MRMFFFNELCPKSIVIQDAVLALEKTIVEYWNIKKDYPDSIDGIITSSLAEKVNISDKITLSDCIKSINNRDLRNYSYMVFQKYPIDNYSDVDTVLNEGIEYYFQLNGANRDALHIRILSNEEGSLFSLNLHQDLAKNELPITSSDKNSFEISNLYGDADNTRFIKDLLDSDLESKFDNIGKLEFILKEPFLSNKFRKEFNAVSKQIQDQIIEGFITIIENEKTGTLIPETLLKDVTPIKEKLISIKELKLRDPIAKRIYFAKIKGRYHIASLENKPLKDRLTSEQSNHIKNAISQIRQSITFS